MKTPKYYECTICGKRFDWLNFTLSKHLKEVHGITVNKTSDLAKRFKAVYEKEKQK